MRLITAVIKPFKLDEVRQAVLDLEHAVRVRTGETGTQAI